MNWIRLSPCILLTACLIACERQQPPFSSRTFDSVGIELAAPEAWVWWNSEERTLSGLSIVDGVWARFFIKYDPFPTELPNLPTEEQFLKRLKEFTPLIHDNANYAVRVSAGGCRVATTFPKSPIPVLFKKDGETVIGDGLWTAIVVIQGRKATYSITAMVFSTDKSSTGGGFLIKQVSEIIETLKPNC